MEQVKMATLLEELKRGKNIKVKHPQYAFTIHAELKLEDNMPNLQVYLQKINLPQKASRGEKLLLKLVQIYCWEVLCNNLLNDVVGSVEYKKILNRLKIEKGLNL
jgi:hypothetical protein